MYDQLEGVRSNQEIVESRYPSPENLWKFYASSNQEIVESETYAPVAGSCGNVGSNQEIVESVFLLSSRQW